MPLAFDIFIARISRFADYLQSAINEAVCGLVSAF